jgi:hypothetical protein
LFTVNGKTFQRCHSERSEESQSNTSRLSVAISDYEASVRIAQTGLLLLLLRSDLCKYALKTRIICTIQKGDFLCFQALLSFVPTIFVFLRNSFFSSSPGPFRSLERPGSPGARLRQTVPNTTTIIGYHKADSLSSEKWAVVQFAGVAASLARQMAAYSRRHIKLHHYRETGNGRACADFAL